MFHSIDLTNPDFRNLVNHRHAIQNPRKRISGKNANNYENRPVLKKLHFCEGKFWK